MDDPHQHQNVESGTGADAVAEQPSPGRAPWLRFAVVFGTLAVGSEIAYYAVVLDSDLFRAYLRLLARVCGVVFGVFTDGISVHGAQISGFGVAVEVAHGCDALQVCALPTAAVIAFPAPLSSKARGIVLGILVLQILNLMRIMSLFVIGAKISRVFQTTHELVWPTLLIIATITIWILWVRRETRGGDELEQTA